MPLKIGLPLFSNHCLCFNVLYLGIVLEREINDKRYGLIRINQCIFITPVMPIPETQTIKKPKKKLRPAEEFRLLSFSFH